MNQNHRGQQSNSPEQDNSPERGSPKSVQQTETKRLGTGMLVVGMLIGLGLLTQFFQNILDKQHNPNQTVHTTQLNNDFIEIILKRNRAGHYVSTGLINGHKTVFLLDTGATFVAIPERQAQRLALKKGPAIQISTANGLTKGYRTTIKQLSIGDIQLYDIKAVITPNLKEVLLGMSVLKQLEFTQRGDQLSIRQFL